jgi:hypothetical protein
VQVALRDVDQRVRACPRDLAFDQELGHWQRAGDPVGPASEISQHYDRALLFQSWPAGLAIDAITVLTDFAVLVLVFRQITLGCAYWGRDNHGCIPRYKVEQQRLPICSLLTLPVNED